MQTQRSIMYCTWASQKKEDKTGRAEVSERKVCLTPGHKGKGSKTICEDTFSPRGENETEKSHYHERNWFRSGKKVRTFEWGNWSYNHSVNFLLGRPEGGPKL